MSSGLLRVLHVIPSLSPADGGPSEAALKMTAELRRSGVEATLASTDADGRRRLSVPLGSMHEQEGVPTIFFRRQFSESFKYSRPLATWLGEHVAEFDAVHIHGVFSHSCLAAAQACRRSSIPYIVRPLGALERWSLRQKLVRKRVALALGARRMLAKAAAVHYTTIRERWESERMLGLSNGIVIPLGVDPPSLGAPPNSDLTPSSRTPLSMWRGEAGPSILFLSRLHPKKGVELLLGAFARVTARDAVTPAEAGVARGGQLGTTGAIPAFSGMTAGEAGMTAGDAGMTVEGEASYRLIIAGSGEPAYEKELRRLAESLGIAERVSFPGWLDGAAKAAALADADLFVLPSAQENFGLSVLEAMAAGVPVAVSREVDLSDDVELAGAGWVFERNPASLAAVLREALSGEEERRSMGIRGRELVEQRYQWPGITKELQSLYRSIIAAPFPSSDRAFVETGESS